MSKPIIAITARIEENDRGNPPLNGVRNPYLDSIVAAGGIPLIIPVLPDAAGVSELLSLAHGLLLPGGADVDPKHYSEEALPCMGKIEALRDITELTAIKLARERKLPILGICRGIQILNVALGGNLYQDVNVQRPNIPEHKSGDWHDMLHDISVSDGSKLKELIGKSKITVNSLHHQAIKELANDLKATAYSPDGLVEAVESKDPSEFILGIQCHPEVLWQDIEPKWGALFKALVDKSNQLKANL